MNNRLPWVRAFTLIEVVLAVALSTAVLLAGFTAVRSAARSIANLNQVSRENALLHSGVMAAIEDADFWNSEANPEFPWARAYMGFRNVDANGTRLADDADTQATGTAAYTAANHGSNKRLFRRVDRTTGSVEDPNWMLPHDARAWFRNSWLPNNRPAQLWQYTPNGALTSRSTVNNNNNTNWSTTAGSIPACWTPRHVLGDYAELANPLGGTLQAWDPAEVPYRSNRAQLFEALFRELGPVGLASYLPIGSLSWYQRPTTNLYGAAVNDVAKHFDKGEIPWALDRPKFLRGNGVQTTSNDADDGKWLTTVETTTQAANLTAVRHYNRLNLVEGLMVANQNYPRDLLSMQLVHALLYGARVHDEPTMPWSRITDAVRRGYSQEAIGALAYQGFANANVSWLTGQVAQENRNETWLNPALPSGSASPGDADRGGLPTLRYWTYRLRYRGADTCNLAVIVQDPETRRTVACSFSVLGTTFRGARQHWSVTTRGFVLSPTTHRLVTSAPSPAAIGDVYAP